MMRSAGREYHPFASVWMIVFTFAIKGLRHIRPVQRASGPLDASLSTGTITSTIQPCLSCPKSKPPASVLVRT
jgi:hypothetical protein